MIMSVKGKTPQVAASAWIAPTAILIGDVVIEDDVSIWFGAVLRADFGAIVVRRGANLQDNVVVHSEAGIVTEIGEDVTVGHGAILEGCKIGRGSLVGMNATVLGGAEIGEQVLVAAGSVVREHAQIPSGVLIAGQPAEIKKELSGSSKKWLEVAAPDYRAMMEEYRATAQVEGLPTDEESRDDYIAING